MKKKEILAGGYVRDIRFDCEATRDAYLEDLIHEYRILDQHTQADGKVIIRLLTSYNNTPLIELYEED